MKLINNLLLSLWIVGSTASPVLVNIAIHRCTPLNAAVRKEWSELTKAQRLDYIEALFCLRRLPSVLSNEQFPGVQDRFDDFVATHINYTAHVHNDGLLLPWHRHFIHLFEKALREECGYTGYLPYWDWPRWDGNVTSSPIFDDSPTSLSGDGAYDPKEPVLCNAQVGCIGRGTGGGCVKGGPFKNWELHMGPFDLTSTDVLYQPLSPDAFNYNPRCLMRSINEQALKRFTDKSVVERMQASKTINDFLAVMDPSIAGLEGAHAGGHIALGPTMVDVFSSVQDPVFMLHHGMVDRMWAMWQAQDAENRRFALNGTAWIFNPAWAPLVTPETVVEFGVLGEPRKVRELMDAMEEDYCYVYT